MEHRGTKEMWADGNTKPLQGAEFRLFRSKVMGISENYDDEEERVRTHPLLLPKPKKAGVVPSNDLQVLADAMGVQTKDREGTVESTPQMTPTPVGRRSVLDNMKYGPGNRPYWEMKEGRVQSRYPDLIRALTKEPDPTRRRQLRESHKSTVGQQIGKPGTRIEARGTEVPRQ